MPGLSIKISVWCSIVCLASGAAAAQQPDALNSLLASAQQAQAKSDFQAAAEFYRQAVTLHPEIAELQANLGVMYYQTGKDGQASEAFRAAIRLKSRLFVPNLFLGLDYVRLKRFKEAIPYLKQAALLKPADLQTQLGLGQAYGASGDVRLAIRSYLRATQIEPEKADVWYQLGVRYLEQVEGDARILLTRYKDSPYVLALMADNFAEQHAFIQAAESYKRVVTSSALPPGTHASYGFVLISQRHFSAAERELNAELSSNPGSLIGKLGIARLQVEQAAIEQAAHEIVQIWKADADFLVANAPRLTAGLAEAKRSTLQNALEAAQATGDLPEEAVALFGSNVAPDIGFQGPASYAHSPALSKTGPVTKAAELYARGKYRQCTNLLASHPQMLRARELRVLVVCAYSTGDYRQAFDASTKLALNSATQPEGLYWETKSAQRLATKALEHASELDSGSPKLHILLGDLYRQRKSFPDAEQEYRKALALAPNDTGALLGLCLALLADNQLDEALHLAQAALKNNSNDPELNTVMGEVLCARDDFAGAEQYLKKSMNTKPEYVSHVHALLGSVYAKTNRTEEAIAELKLALTDDKDGHIHYQIGRLYLKTGDRESAKQAFAISDRLRTEGLNRAAVAMQQTQVDIESR